MSISQITPADRVAQRRVSDTGGSLSPAQDKAFARLVEAVQVSPCIILLGEPGSGKTTLLNRLIRQKGGLRIDGRDLTLATSYSAHACIEEQFDALIENALGEHDLVVIDDCESVLQMATQAKGYGRPGFIAASIRHLADSARAAGKTIVFSGTTFETDWGPYIPSLPPRSMTIEIPPLEARDFAHFFRLELGAKAEKLDAEEIYQYASSLNIYNIKQISRLIEQNGSASSDFVRDLIDTRVIRTNTRLGEVENITFDDLKGFEHIIDQLTTFVINPLKQDPRFATIGLKPKRGVLLYGPPGTGKTSIGRALAHQMKGKFFIIDGTIPPEPAGDFFQRIKQVFEAAKSATPSVIFIDDADVLFQSDRSTSLNRYLLTMLDGLESETAGKVAVIMTAMDPNHMPQALLRSGRVELWLETKPPAAGTRAEIIAAHLAQLPTEFRYYDVQRINGLTEGFNAADMRRVVADVKALYATDVIEGRPPEIPAYFETAALNVQRNKQLLTMAASGDFNFAADPVAGGRSEAEKKKSRLREEMNACEGE